MSDWYWYQNYCRRSATTRELNWVPKSVPKSQCLRAGHSFWRHGVQVAWLLSWPTVVPSGVPACRLLRSGLQRPIWRCYLVSSGGHWQSPLSCGTMAILGRGAVRYLVWCGVLTWPQMKQNSMHFLTSNSRYGHQNVFWISWVVQWIPGWPGLSEACT